MAHMKTKYSLESVSTLLKAGPLLYLFVVLGNQPVQFLAVQNDLSLTDVIVFGQKIMEASPHIIDFPDQIH